MTPCGRKWRRENAEWRMLRIPPFFILHSPFSILSWSHQGHQGRGMAHSVRNGKWKMEHGELGKSETFFIVHSPLVSSLLHQRLEHREHGGQDRRGRLQMLHVGDRKSTRLNS